MKFKNFTPAEHETWKQLFQRQVPLRSQQLVHEFEEGIEFLGLNENGIPDLDQVNQRLKQRTGFQGVPVTGHEDPRSFFPMLSERLFPIGNFIRDARDINYTPAPDVFHDLYGHLPFLADPAHADFQQEFGKRASAYIHDSHKLRQWERLYWFTAEFATLLESGQGENGQRKIIGAGIASSFGECAYSLSDQPQLIGFDIEKIRKQEFEIDHMQNILFVLTSREQLYGCLSAFEQGLESLAV